MAIARARSLKRPVSRGLRADEELPWRPQFVAFVVSFLAFLAVGTWTWFASPGWGMLDAYLAVFWSLPTLTSLIGCWGALATRQRVRDARWQPDAVPPTAQQLLVVIPTVGRMDTLPALERVIRSTSQALPTYFDRFRVDVVIEELCPARGRIEEMVVAHPHTAVVVIPRGYKTANRTRFKARANQYANVLRLADGQVREDVWVLHLDDDTEVRSDTAAELARFLAAQERAGEAGMDLAQGVLCYPRELAESRLVWLADAIRPGCDISLFSATTGSGSPRGGLHGEMLVVRASVEAAIGWDFGPRTLVEDAQFALHFCARYPGRSAWIPARSYGASPACPSDLIRQRERWVWGLLELVTGRSQRYAGSRSGPVQHPGLSRREGLLLLHNTMVWACAPLGHLALVLFLCLLLQDFETSPPFLFLVPVWSFNAAFGVWLYWEGFRLNATSSAQPRRQWWEPFCLLALAPLFALWEVAGILLGIFRFVGGREPRFTVISKPI